LGHVFSQIAAALGERYVLERELGRGGMATVYLAQDLKHHRLVALKVLRPDLASVLGGDRFLREITIAAQLQHPHILPLHDSGEAAGFLYYVMPYVEGESLRDRLIREGQFSIPEAVRILREVVDALSYAHAHKVIHRDIKLANVLLSGRHALVSDFGVAKAVSEAALREELTTVGIALGTPAYMAPEQAAADPATDHRADLYAVGVVMYEMLAGQPPFGGRTPQQILAAHAAETPVPLSNRRPAVPAPVANVVHRLLEKRPADRPQSAEEVIRLLDASSSHRSPRFGPISRCCCARAPTADWAPVLRLTPTSPDSPSLPPRQSRASRQWSPCPPTKSSLALRRPSSPPSC
jgi:eukaryotic-like serine/threonine-protein kinase